MKVLAVAFLGLALLSTAKARLGETKDELIQRYGQVVKEEDKEKELGGSVLTFLFKDYEVEVIIVSTTLCGIRFTNTAESVGFKKKNGKKIEETEVNALMGDYGKKDKWMQPDRPPVFRSRESDEFYLKDGSKNNGVICFIHKNPPYGISFFTEKYIGAIIQAGVSNMSPPGSGK